MPSQFQQALEMIRNASTNTVDRGTSFEKLVKVFLENDATQTQHYEKVWHYADWAKQHPGYSQKDIGIDLVAKIRDENTFCAIQCKIYGAENAISKEDLDSFISASASSDFSRLLLVDTSNVGIGKNAQHVFDNLDKEYLRIQSTELESSLIDWVTFVREDRVRLRKKHGPLEHQKQALAAVKEGLAEADRGKLIMACGTGKTFTSLLVAQTLAGKGKLVLYMVPSLSLMSQSIREWKNDAVEDFTAFSACSDKTVGNRKSDDQVIVSLHDLAFPATTDPKQLASRVKNANPDKMTVVFSTYHSIDVIKLAQIEFGLEEFDLIICDEAHRTTGATLSTDDDESTFVQIHSNENVKGAKRLYMTATPRIYGEKAKEQAENENVNLASMDDEKKYGKVLFHRGFGWAVENNLLTDYKVVVLAVDEGIVSENVQNRLAEGSELKLDDATKIVGCYKALGKVGFQDKKTNADTASLKPMRRALAFCQNIKLSKLLEDEFVKVVDEYTSKEGPAADDDDVLKVEVKHVDGGFDADLRTERLNWLRDDTDNNVCRVLTNVRCLSEGVDVPTLDAIIFMHPRKSQIDVVQSVGRVMRLSAGKELGYVILPITVAPGISPEKALNDNEKYKVVWQILNALRAHDERFDSTINRLGLGEVVSERLEIVGVGAREELEATTAVVKDIKPKKKDRAAEDTRTDNVLDDAAAEQPDQQSFILGDLSQAIKAKIVERCGTRDYWENWAHDIAKIAQQHITRIQGIVLNEGTAERIAFDAFLDEIRDDLNPEITRTEAIEMLAQHLITKPVFDTLFQGNKFTAENTVSKAMQSVLDTLYRHNIEKEADSLEKFYASVKRRAADIITATGRQKLILEIYDRFFRNAFPLLTERLGIVYTPVEVVDFIIHSVSDVLNDEFGKGLGDRNVHVLDPFTGTGTFITRLMQSGTISSEDLPYKFRNEIHANEIVLLAYYIAAINIEAVYQDIAKDNQYQPFNGIVLTDTFQLYEQSTDMVANLLPDNSSRRKRQKERKITVIVGNPPYSAGQKSANDNAANIKYPNLDSRIESTYAAASTATLKNSLYASYIRAFRWASDRIGDEGVIGFVSGAGWIDANSTDGLRKHLCEEFSKIYVFHLRGNTRTAGEIARKEGGQIFGSGSRSPIAITILVKNPNSTQKGQILFCDIGDYFDREEKLSVIKHYKSVNGISAEHKWVLLTPDEHHDWVKQGEKLYATFPLMGSSAESDNALFCDYSNGVSTQRDAWCYNYSAKKLSANCDGMAKFYNDCVEKFSNLPVDEIRKVVPYENKRISWSDYLLMNISRGRRADIRNAVVVPALYRPYTKSNLFFSRDFNDRQGQIPRILPNSNVTNRIIAVSGIASRFGFSVIMTDTLPDRTLLASGAQCFPLYFYEKPKPGEGLFAGETYSNEYVKSDGISDVGLMHFHAAYSRADITKDDVFYYVYGLLHSSEYRERFDNNLSKELPRIPAVKRFDDFKKFSEAGRKLGDLHLNYEKVAPYPVTYKEGDLRLANVADPKAFYRVTKMKFVGVRGKADKTTVIYNHNITMMNIPIEAYNYILNGKSALDWIMERQSVKTDKDSDIVNDANDYANETMNNPAYPLELFQRVITVSLETVKIVKSLPTLEVN
jgi:predicted helicase